TLYRSDQDRIHSVGWEVDTLEALDELVAGLRGRGIEVTAGDAALKDDRKVREIVYFTEPHLKLRTELFYGPLACNVPFTPTRGISGYLTKGLGLGHVVFSATDPHAAVDFYCEALGFKISDYIIWDENDATFLHCNPRHHSLAIMNEVGGLKNGDLNHVMIEAKTFDDVGYAFDIVRDRGVPLFLDMGKHSNDHMQSFYMRTPSGFCIEYGYGGRMIGTDWEIRTYDQPMLFGHRLVK
ncbi:MAG TPA: VOC family protein, partial [Stellaceae bacterium]|nr:VOC family protein [Stellaceae bacterium]